jgi:uncharacterized protein YegP (UPF0339 family)
VSSASISPTAYFLIYRDDGVWRWALYALDLKKIADSGAGYASRLECEDAIGLVQATNTGTPVRYTP